MKDSSSRRVRRESSPHPMKRKGSRRQLETAPMESSSTHSHSRHNNHSKSTGSLSRTSDHRRRGGGDEEDNSTSDRTLSESGWHNVIEKQDWVALQGYLEQVQHPPPLPSSLPGASGNQPPLPPSGDYKKKKKKSSIEKSSKKKKKKDKQLMLDMSSQSTMGIPGYPNTKKKKRSSSLHWLWKRSVRSSALSLGASSRSNNNHMDTMSMSMNNMSRRSRASAASGYSSDHDDEPERESTIVEEEELRFHMSPDHPSFDKEALLSTNMAGRTPLQLALNTPEIPDHMLRAFILAQPRAVAIADAKGRLPLHFAVVRQRPLSIIAKLVELNPQALHQQDQKGKTPVIYAIEVAKRQTDLETAPRGFWAPIPAETAATPGQAEASSWQDEQAKRWGTTRWLLEKSAQAHHQQAQQNTIVLATGPISKNTQIDHNHPFLIRNASTQKISQPILIEAMLHAAPPAAVTLLISASSFLLSPASSAKSSRHDQHQQQQQHEQQRISLGCSAMYLAIFRQYPISILKQLAFLLADVKEVKGVRDETGLGLVSAHYVTSCFKKSKLLEYVAEEDFMLTMEQCIVEGQLPSAAEGQNAPFLQWWEKLKFLIFFCAGKDPEQTPDDYLLHAALENTDTPPNVVRLLLGLYPGSGRQPDTQSAHPLHRFAMHRDYVPRNYESPYMHGLNCMDMLLSLDESAAFHNFQNRLPLHHAILAGRTWSTIHPLVSSYRSSLRIPDPVTKLYPCQLAAAYQEEDSEKETIRLLQLTRNQYSSIVWQGLSMKQQHNAVERIRQFESLKRLDTVYELLRRSPQCVESVIDASSTRTRTRGKKEKTKEDVLAVQEQSGRDRDKSARKGRNENNTGPEMITFHYLSWCYKKNSGHWEVEENNMNILQTNIRVALEHRVLSQRSTDFVNWWGMLKMYFWHCYSSMDAADKPYIPKEEEYLLHVAVSISTSPPDLIALILGLNPESASTPLPDSTTFPLHLACRATVYTPQYFETETDRPSTIELLLRAFPEAAFARSSGGRLPLHIAIQAGKTIEELRPLIEQAPTLAGAREPTSGFFPYQLMAVSRPTASDLRLRFRTLAANRHTDKWNKFSGQEKMKEIRVVEKEYQADLLTSTFELLRLSPSSISQRPTSQQQSRRASAGLRRRGSGNNLFDSDSDDDLTSEGDMTIDSDEESYDGGKRGSILSGMSSRQGSAFSSIDMMSTISNVSSHLSFRQNNRSNGRLSMSLSGSLTGSLMHDHIDEDDDDQSEDSEIWSVEDVTFHQDPGKAPAKGPNNYAGNVSPNQRLSPVPRVERKKSSWEAPIHFAAKPEESPVATHRPSIPKIIMEPLDYSDDVSCLLDDTRSRSGRVVSALRRSLLEEASLDGHLMAESDNRAAEKAPEYHAAEKAPDTRVAEKEPDMLAAEEEPDIRAAQKEPDPPSERRSNELDENRVAQPSATFPFGRIKREKQRAKAGSPVPVKDAHRADEALDDSIHDEFFATGHVEKPEPDESVVVFRLRRSRGGQRASGQGRGKGGRQSGSSRNMDFLSILNASLPEGKMDYLSTLEVSASSLPPGYDSMPTGLDARDSKVDRLAQIEEFPGESEHGTVARQESERFGPVRQESAKLSPAHRESSPPKPRTSQLRQSILDSTGLADEVKHAVSNDSRGTITPKSSSHNSRRSMTNSPSPNSTSRRSSLEISPRTCNYIGVKPQKLKSCLQCGMNGREVMMLPCSHLCLCQACAEDDVKSCPICFGPVNGIKVMSLFQAV
ncbi:expressed unknown protein [Seminavis robusta]|uniref:RING-type domain-containing protein n=1 Tax=Seminavis robusta TaxID=568900 RepID=A0A9N8EKZ1_9STRA|nr:expressed unknown protein [Seminavis robusta]|eukprot:Sro1136_g245150.1 n/a (1747) ;mRNA; r:8773-14013